MGAEGTSLHAAGGQGGGGGGCSGDGVAPSTGPAGSRYPPCYD